MQRNNKNKLHAPLGKHFFTTFNAIHFFSEFQVRGPPQRQGVAGAATFGLQEGQRLYFWNTWLTT